MPRRLSIVARWACRAGAMLAALIVSADATAGEAAGAKRIHNLFAQFELPDHWETKFWADPNAKALLTLDTKALAELVPVQAGIRHTRCPACDATEASNSLTWSVSRPKVLTCRHCQVTVPNETYPAKDEKEKKVPEDVVQVLHGVSHHYPYHVVEPAKQRYPDEKLYLAAKRDYEAREFLAKAALYAAVRYHEQPAESKDPALVRLASVLILRFAQVYPAYATHFDQPLSPKVFQQADLPPPYRRGYQTGKWDWTASLDVPLNLLIAYALIRDQPALLEAGRSLNDAHPARTIERDLFRASAEFVRLQREEYSEVSLHAYRGLLAAGRLLDDPQLIGEAVKRLDGFSERGFYYDGFWRQGDAAAHRRILSVFDGWIDRLLAGYPETPRPLELTSGPNAAPAGEIGALPMLALARRAGSAALTDPRVPEIQQVSWPAAIAAPGTRRPSLLGGVGLARLAIGEKGGALDLEVRGQDNIGAPHFQRQALRLAVGGQLVLGDLDEQAPTVTGWDRATASHNTVVVDGLNQRESLGKASEPALGGDFLFFAADPDFQVLSLDDPRAYPQSTTRYRQTLVAAAGSPSSYAVSVFEVHGGLQHDQLFHAASGSRARWRLSVAMGAGPASLLPESIPYVPSARAEDGRWFVQAYGEFAPLAQVHLTRPAIAWLGSSGAPGVRLHLLGPTPVEVITANSPDPATGAARANAEDSGRAGLVVRHRSPDGSTLKTTFVTLFEPTGSVTPLTRVGRVASSPETVVVYVESAGGTEHLVINLAPGTTQTVELTHGQTLRTDGLVVRVSPRGLVLAGGTFAESAGLRVEQQPSTGAITGVVRHASGAGRGWFESDQALRDDGHMQGRTILIRHGNDVTRAWTLQQVENMNRGSRLYVLEEPGFALETKSSAEARYYQFPRISAPGPHQFRVSKITRTPAPQEGPK
ncbi:hypothetical protein SAMN05444166_2891 [Singulisphaera sp. GP187]|uniref:heparinase II/III family protein n=1 Tax=Singulisphaera sp. GP187 TaxID=1882752 RepID=UPI0009272554|nr:heparinase II/III family protein [Singulisphaera sp. GP187]SIO18830.1 hypothetical protein SAMN05444166_2891 [Singulisphaera sp. GP187]